MPAKPQARSPRNYLARREQRRLFWLVMTLGLVLVLIGEARKPHHWYWLWGGEPPSDAPLAADAAIDTRLADARDAPLQPGTFIARADNDTPAGRDDSYPPGVQTELLADVRDDTVFLSGDHAGFFHLLDILRNTDPGQLAAASIGEVSFVQIYKQPAEYRGRLVTMRGTVRRAGWRDAPENELGIAGYYHTVLQPIHRPENLVVIYCLNLPDGFPTGESVAAENVTLTGFFFKRWAYRAGDGIRTAPLLLARTVQWQPTVARNDESPLDPVRVAWLVAGAVGIGLTVTGAVVFIALRRRRRSLAAVTVGANAGTADDVHKALGNIDAGPGPREALRALQQQAAEPTHTKNESQ